MNNKMNDKDINEIVSHVFLSNWATSNNPYIYEKYNIKAVITLVNTPKPFNIVDYYDRNSIEHMHIYIEDMPTENVYRHFDQTYDFIKHHTNHHQNVLVHCAAGVSRSAIIVLNYMIRNMFETQFVRGQDANEIVKYVLYITKMRRPIVNPNYGFLQQLYNKTEEYIFGN